MITVPLSEASQQLERLRNQLTAGSAPEAASLTENGKPVLALVPWELYEALVELAEIAQDPRSLLASPPGARERMLVAAAAHAEAIYRTDRDLTDFEAYGAGDLLDSSD